MIPFMIASMTEVACDNLPGSPKFPRPSENSGASVSSCVAGTLAKPACYVRYDNGKFDVDATSSQLHRMQRDGAGGARCVSPLPVTEWYTLRKVSIRKTAARNMLSRRG